MKSDRRQKDDERRRARQQPRCDADAEDPLRGQRVVGVVVVHVVRHMSVAVLAMVVAPAVVVVIAGASRAESLPENGGADDHDEDARDESEPWVEHLGDDERGEPERHEAEREHSGRMGDGDRSAQ
jgi:hypothetical protein